MYMDGHRATRRTRGYALDLPWLPSLGQPAATREPWQACSNKFPGDDVSDHWIYVALINFQIAKGIDLKGGLSRSLSLEFDGGGGPKKKSLMLLHDSLLTSSSSPYSLSLPPPPIATNSPGHDMDENTILYNPSPKSARIVEEILDLRLKLAL